MRASSGSGSSWRPRPDRAAPHGADPRSGQRVTRAAAADTYRCGHPRWRPGPAGPRRRLRRVPVARRAISAGGAGSRGPARERPARGGRHRAGIVLAGLHFAATAARPGPFRQLAGRHRAQCAPHPPAPGAAHAAGRLARGPAPRSTDGLPSADDLDRADALRAAVADLPPGQRQAVAMFYYADRPASQIAASPGAAKASLHKARRRLRAYISAHRPDLIPAATRRTPMTAVASRMPSRCRGATPARSFTPSIRSWWCWRTMRQAGPCRSGYRTPTASRCGGCLIRRPGAPGRPTCPRSSRARP